MKYLITTSLILFFAISLFGQTIQELKDSIVEKIERSHPLANFDNKIFFSNLPLPDAEVLTGRSINYDEYEHLIIYIKDGFSDEKKEDLLWRSAQSIDIRGITEVSATRHSNEYDYYTLSLRVDGKYLAVQYNKSFIDAQPDYRDISEMIIFITDNTTLAEKIKYSIIKLCEHLGISIKDGDKP